MAKHYKYVNGKKMVVINNYDLGADVIPEEMELIPDITAADAGKVLTADSNGEPVWDDVPEELPSLAGNAGKVLTVNSGATGTEWKDAPSGLPAVTIDDAGDVLTVNASGEWEAAAPSGGGLDEITGVWSEVYYDDEVVYLKIPSDSERTGCFILNIPTPPELNSGWHYEKYPIPGSCVVIAVVQNKLLINTIIYDDSMEDNTAECFMADYNSQSGIYVLLFPIAQSSPLG